MKDASIGVVRMMAISARLTSDTNGRLCMPGQVVVNPFAEVPERRTAGSELHEKVSEHETAPWPLTPKSA